MFFKGILTCGSDKELSERDIFTSVDVYLISPELRQPSLIQILTCYQVTRISIDESGRLVIDLKTVAKFRGQFVLQHPNLEDRSSRLVAPEDLEIQFALELVWTASTWDGPEQVRWLFLGRKVVTA